MDDLNQLIFITGIILACSCFASKISSFMGVPVLLLFLFIGMMFGTDGLFFKINLTDYNLTFIISNIALAIILLDGGCQTNFNSFKSVARHSILLATIGTLLTTVIAGLAIKLIFNFSFLQSMLIGAIVGSTDAGAVFNLLGNSDITLKPNVKHTIESESATNDPMAIFLTITIINIMNGVLQMHNIGASFVSMSTFFVKQFLFGIGLGVLFGYVAKYVVNHITIPAALYSLLVLGIGFTGFAITSWLGGSGFLAIFIIGMFIGNQKSRQLRQILPVQNGLSWLAQIILFLLLGLLVEPANLTSYASMGCIIALIITFIARPIAVFICTIKTKLSLQEKSFISWVGIRGSVPIVLAIYPIINDIPNGEFYFNIAFVIVMCSMLLQGMTLKPIAKLFGVFAPHTVAPIGKGNVGFNIDDDFVIFNYEITHDAFKQIPLAQIKFPSQTIISSIYRRGLLLKPTANTYLTKKDVISILGHSEDEDLLNNLFNQDEPRKKEFNPYNGDIILSAKISMLEAANTYGIPVTANEYTLTLGEFISYKLGGFPQVGDRTVLNGNRFTIYELEGDIVTKIGYEKLNDNEISNLNIK